MIEFNADYWRDLYEERAAILEFDGGVLRAEAERVAQEFVAQQKKEKLREFSSQLANGRR